MTRLERHWMALIAALLLFAPASADAARRTPLGRHPATTRESRSRRGHAPRSAHRAQRTNTPRSEEERALLALRQDGEARVQALLKATRGWTDKAMLEARARRIEEMRRDTRERQLQVRAAFARRRGDHAEAAAIESEMGRDPRGRRRGA